MRRGALTTVVTLAFGLGSNGDAAAQQQAEATFPFEPWNARAVALGDAGVADHGLAFVAVNPAAAAGAHGAALSFRDSPAGLRDFGLEAAYAARWGTLAVAVRRRGWDEVARDLGLPDLSATEQSISATYTLALAGDRVRFGLGAARLDTDFLGAQAGGWAFDVGAQAAPTGRLRLGASLLHLGSGYGPEDDRPPLPTRLRGGVAWTVAETGGVRLVTTGDVATPLELDGGADAHVGFSLGGGGAFSWEARAGLRRLADRHGNGSDESAWTAGGAVGFGRVRAEIATADRGALGRDLVLSLAFHW